jgi:prepilin signal peptidase PulO-like enzyme (type II secretory pathway)
LQVVETPLGANSAPQLVERRASTVPRATALALVGGALGALVFAAALRSLGGQLNHVLTGGAALAGATGLAACAVLDARLRLLPTHLVTATGTVPFLLLALAEWSPPAAEGSASRAAAAAGLTWLAFVLLRVVSGGGVPYGDVRLAAAAAVVPGWVSWAAVGVMAVAAFILAGVHVAFVSRNPAIHRQSHPFAPALALGWFLSLMLMAHA